MTSTLAASCRPRWTRWTEKQSSLTRLHTSTTPQPTPQNANRWVDRRHQFQDLVGKSSHQNLPSSLLFLPFVAKSGIQYQGLVTTRAGVRINIVSIGSIWETVSDSAFLSPFPRLASNLETVDNYFEKHHKTPFQFTRRSPRAQFLLPKRAPGSSSITRLLLRLTTSNMESVFTKNSLWTCRD